MDPGFHRGSDGVQHQLLRSPRPRPKIHSGLGENTRCTNNANTTSTSSQAPERRPLHRHDQRPRPPHPRPPLKSRPRPHPQIRYCPIGLVRNPPHPRQRLPPRKAYQGMETRLENPVDRNRQPQLARPHRNPDLTAPQFIAHAAPLPTIAVPCPTRDPAGSPSPCRQQHPRMGPGVRRGSQGDCIYPLTSTIAVPCATRDLRGLLDKLVGALRCRQGGSGR